MKDVFIRVRKSSMYTYMYKVLRTWQRVNAELSYILVNLKVLTISMAIQMKGQNETEPSFVHSVKPMNKGKMKDE